MRLNWNIRNIVTVRWMMSSHMSVQITRLSSFISTIFTHIGFFPSVCKQMFTKICFITSSVSTLATAISERQRIAIVIYIIDRRESIHECTKRACMQQRQELNIARTGCKRSWHSIPLEGKNAKHKPKLALKITQ